MRCHPLAMFIAVLLATGPLLSSGACGEQEPAKVVIKHEGQQDRAAREAAEKTPEEAYEERRRARENQPEPELNPEDPREKFELVWCSGKKAIKSIHHERFDILQRMREIQFEDDGDKERVTALADKLQEYTIGKKKEQLETAAQRLCDMIEEVRLPAEEIIDAGMAELGKIEAQLEALDAKQEAGETVLQRQFDKLEKQKKRWSRPVEGAKFVFLAVKSMLQEAYILADYGPRRAQITLRDCLSEIAKKPLPYDLAQDQLEKVISRAKWYRDLR